MHVIDRCFCGRGRGGLSRPGRRDGAGVALSPPSLLFQTSQGAFRIHSASLEFGVAASPGHFLKSSFVCARVWSFDSCSAGGEGGADGRANGVVPVIRRKEVGERGRKSCGTREDAPRTCLTETRQARGVATAMPLGYYEGAALR